jgi:hypothetical protein
MRFTEVLMPYTALTGEAHMLDTLQQERGEVLASVFQALRSNPADPDAIAACAYLVRHLQRESGN